MCWSKRQRWSQEVERLWAGFPPCPPFLVLFIPTAAWHTCCRAWLWYFPLQLWGFMTSQLKRDIASSVFTVPSLECLSFKSHKMEIKCIKKWMRKKQFFEGVLPILLILVATHSCTFCLLARSCVLLEMKPLTWLCGNFATVLRNIQNWKAET